MELADQANAFVENTAPWSLKKDPRSRFDYKKCARLCSTCFGKSVCIWRRYSPEWLINAVDCCSPRSLVGKIVKPPSSEPLYPNLSIYYNALHRESTSNDRRKQRSSTCYGGSDVRGNDWPSDTPQRSCGFGEALLAEPLAPVCTIDDFAKVDLRVARIPKPRK